MTTALVLIDLQQGLFPQGHTELEAVAARLNRLLTTAKERQCAIFAVHHQAPGTPFMPEQPAWRWLAAVPLPETAIRIDKTTPDSFLNTPLQRELQARGVTRLVIGGYASEFCIDTTVRRAAALGFAVDLIADGHLTHDKAHASSQAIIAHENATLSAIKSFGVSIQAVPAADISWPDKV